MKNDEMIASMGMDGLGVSVPLNVVTRYQKAKISRFFKDGIRIWRL
ncbi:MAG: hypothetical protein KL787_02430 [Taibaiella sp.]|nr:hypothetical protein [Taibaiella sp.]